MDCNFCGSKIPRGTEYIFVTSKGKALYFDSSKCMRNLVHLNRKPRETKWTQAYFDEKEARLKLLGHDKAPPKAPTPKVEVKEEPKEKKPKAAKTKEAKGKQPKKPKSK
ncbi:MAG: hypothetical protein V1744_04985 [Candidatus Altiarchaeota archaeon]